MRERLIKINFWAAVTFAVSMVSAMTLTWVYRSSFGLVEDVSFHASNASTVVMLGALLTVIVLSIAIAVKKEEIK